jgi:hypothetical protein
MIVSIKPGAVRWERRDLHVADTDKYDERDRWPRITRSSSTGSTSNIVVELFSTMYTEKYGCRGVMGGWGHLGMLDWIFILEIFDPHIWPHRRPTPKILHNGRKKLFLSKALADGSRKMHWASASRKEIGFILVVNDAIIINTSEGSGDIIWQTAINGATLLFGFVQQSLTSKVFFWIDYFIELRPKRERSRIWRKCMFSGWQSRPVNPSMEIVIASFRDKQVGLAPASIHISRTIWEDRLLRHTILVLL